MKSEARILSSSCNSEICVGFIIRGKGIDGVVIGRGCEGLCKRLEKRGFLGELRYSFGDCSCGLPEPPRTTRIVILYRMFARKVSEKLSETQGTLLPFNL